MKKIDINYKKLLLVIGVMALACSGCRKFLDVGTPITKISGNNAYNDDATATAVITGLYGQLSNNYFYSTYLPATSLFEELSADNLVLFDPPSQAGFDSYYKNALEPTYAASGETYWRTTYQLLYTINTAIVELTGNKNLTPAVSKRLLGEAYFLRAFCYFYLVNIYGDVPLVLTPDYVKNIAIPRTSSALVYDKVSDDLAQAEKLLDYNYAALDVTKTTSDRLRPNLAAVNALQARVYLYRNNYSAAEAAATKVISLSIFSLGNLNEVFLKNSAETIWALQPVTSGYNTVEGQFFKLNSDGPDRDHPIYASASFVNSFEKGDGRKTGWLSSVTTTAGDTYFYPDKYKVPFIDGSTEITEYPIVLRLSEQYLIRAEARNEQGNSVGAVADLNAIRSRSRLIPTPAVPDPLPALRASLSKTELKPLIMRERRVELFAEWGHRWFDLKRSETIDAVMTEAEVYKGGIWEHFKTLYPVPVKEILLDPALTQNQGY
ncbi:RagB/SusD family nutrient uptake outer membrane protein [Mucilaginibacter pineti]|nr:RagB/SusD family nutrient uptake outer membrane protein [Mucilaginibacter pineti]